MQASTGVVVVGTLAAAGLDLPDGEVVVVPTRENEDEVQVSPAVEAELVEAIAEADRREAFSAEELFARLGRIR